MLRLYGGAMVLRIFTTEGQRTQRGRIVSCEDRQTLGAGKGVEKRCRDGRIGRIRKIL